MEAPERRKGERSEPARSGGASTAGSAPADIPDPEVAAKPTRRRFTAEYKRSIVERADACVDSGAVSALLRQEGLYSSHLSIWRRQAREGQLAALGAKRGRKAHAPLADENRKLQAANQRLQKRLADAELIIEVQKKLAALLGRPIPDSNEGNE